MKVSSMFTKSTMKRSPPCPLKASRFMGEFTNMEVGLVERKDNRGDRTRKKPRRH